MLKGFMFCVGYFLLSSFLPIPLMYWTDLHWTFKIGKRVGRINPTFFSWSLKEHCCGNWFSALIRENWHTPHSFCVLAFHNISEDHNTDDPSTSDKSLVNFGPLDPVLQARLRQMGNICTLPCIFVNHICLVAPIVLRNLHCTPIPMWLKWHLVGCVHSIVNVNVCIGKLYAGLCHAFLALALIS